MTTERNLTWSWNQKEEDFPLGRFDDFDGRIITAEYQQRAMTRDDGEEILTTSVFLAIKPMEYEYDARGFEYDPDQIDDIPLGWYSMGSGKFIISEDGTDIIDGPSPQRNSRAVKLITRLNKLPSVVPDGVSLSPYFNLECHWKAVEEVNPVNGTKRAILYPTGEVVGRALVGGGGNGSGNGSGGVNVGVKPEDDE